MFFCFSVLVLCCSLGHQGTASGLPRNLVRDLVSPYQGTRGSLQELLQRAPRGSLRSPLQDPSRDPSV